MCENQECRLGIDKDDTELLRDIMAMLNHLIEHPDIIHEQAPQAVEASNETRKLNNEIARMLDGIDIDRDTKRKKMLEAVTQKYKDIDSAAYTTQRLIAELKNAEPITAFTPELLDKVVQAIILNKNKTIEFILINNQIIRKEATDGNNSKTESR